MSQGFPNPGQGTKAVSANAGAEIEISGVGRFTIERIATVGRAPESHIVLDLRSVSRNHARIFLEGGHYWIKDLDSANGTTVNGKSIKLQMLADQDKISFGDAQATFHTAVRPSGPAALAQDPLAGAEAASNDGTPTGGLEAPRLSPDQAKSGGSHGSGRGEILSGGTEIQALTKKIESLQGENQLLRREIAQFRSTPSMITTRLDSGEEEIGRLQRLVAQLERALADSNLRLRNMQQRLNEKK